MRENSKQQHPASLHASDEDHLETILISHTKEGTVRSVDVVRYLGASKPSVCHAVVLLEGGGSLTMDEDFSLCLTDAGRKVMESIYERHRSSVEKLTAAGIDPKVVEADACRVEHIINAESLERLREATKGMRQA